MLRRRLLGGTGHLGYSIMFLFIAASQQRLFSILVVRPVGGIVEGRQMHVDWDRKGEALAKGKPSHAFLSQSQFYCIHYVFSRCICIG